MRVNEMFNINHSVRASCSSLDNINNISQASLDNNIIREVKDKIEEVLKEVIKNINDIIIHSSSRDLDRFYENDKPMNYNEPTFNIHHSFLDYSSRRNSDDYSMMDVNIKSVLKYNIGNCYEMSCISALLINSILEKRLSALNVSEHTIEHLNKEVCVLGSLPMAGCDHAVTKLKINIDGADCNFIIDSWGRDFFQYLDEQDIGEHYKKSNSYFSNGNIKFKDVDISSFINEEKYIDIFNALINDIHGVNLDDAAWADPFEEARSRRQTELDNLKHKDSYFGWLKII
ncbi:hypothetical protein CBW58_18245 [Yersinia frederiksenii]|nr:hypothetical protein CBW58_18245 [Yersinia frederiksenii]